MVLHDELESCLAGLPSAEARADFQWCIDRAESVIFPIAPEKRPHGSRRPETAVGSAGSDPHAARSHWAARYLAEHCHVLLCLGDGQPDAHPLGAAETVAEADRLGRPVIQVFSQPPYHVAYRRVALSPRSEAPGGFQVYIPHPIDTSEWLLPESLTELTERLAESTHDNWAQRRLAEGWNWGPARDDEAKQHPGLVPYAQLPDTEKNYDRATAIETLKAIMALGYRIDRAE